MSKNTSLSSLINYVSANSSGNVTIAAPSSGYALDVSGTGRFTGNLNVIFANTGGSIDNNAYLRLVNTGAATLNQSIDLVMRWQDGTYNGTGGISMVRESATARSGKLILQPIDSSGNNVSALTLASSGAATFSNSVTAGGAITAQYAGPSRMIIESTTNSNNAGIYFVTKNLNGTSVQGGVYYIPSLTPFLTLSGDNSGTHLNITSSGNVGIGTTSPSAIFTIDKTNTDYTNASAGHILLNNSSSIGQSSIYYTINGTNRGKLRVDQVGNFNYIANGGDHTFWTGGDAGTGSTKMVVTSSGNVGIGTSSPSKLLTVRHGAGDGVRIEYNGNTDSLFLDASNIYALSGSSASVLKINPTGGNVLIGTTTDVGFRLRVNGDASIATNLSVGTTSTLARVSIDGDYADMTGTITYGTNTKGIVINQDAGGGYGMGLWFRQAGLTAGIGSIRVSGGDWATDLRFYTHPSSTTNQNILFERMRINSEGTMINSGNRIQQNSFYGSSQRFVFQSAFDNPTATIFSWTDGGAYAQTMIRVTVIQNTVTGSSSNTSIWSVGYAMIANNPSGVVAQATVSSMVVQGNFGAANVGTLSWDSSNNLRYTSNRASNYDGYVVLVEYGSNTNQGNKPTLYVN